MEENTETRRTTLRRKRAKSPKNQEPVRDLQEHDEEKIEHDEGNIIHNAEQEQGQQEPKKDKRMLSREDAENEVLRRFEETEETRKIIARLAKGK